MSSMHTQTARQELAGPSPAPPLMPTGDIELPSMSGTGDDGMKPARITYVTKQAAPSGGSDGELLLEPPEDDYGDDAYDDTVPLIPTDARRGSIDAPVDRYNAAYWIFYLQGLGCLVPWNAFITVNAYFDKKLDESQFKSLVLPYYTTSFQIVNILLLVLATRVIKHIPLKPRIGIPMAIQLIAFVLILLMVKSDIVGDPFFYYTLALVILSAATTSFYQGGLFGLAGMLPFTYTQSMMGGQGLGGVTVAVLNLLTLVFINDPIEAAFMFFVVAVVVLFLCNVSFYVLLRLPIVRWYIRHGSKHGPDPTDINSLDPADVKSDGLKHMSTHDLVRKVAPMSWSVMLIFAVTLSLFPAIAVKVQSQYKDSHYGERLFIPVYCFLMFNVADLTGRTLASWVQWPPENKPHLMKWAALGRLVFIPLFLLCNVHTGLPSAEREHDTFPTVFHSDAAPYVLMFGLGVTNGYWGTLCMMFGPLMVDPQDGERAGSVMLLKLVIGLGLGSFFAFVLLAIVCNCNSFLGAAMHANATNTTTTPAPLAAVGAEPTPVSAMAEAMASAFWS